MISYQEHRHNEYTLEVFQNPQETLVKLFYKEEELLRLEYLTKTPIIVDCIKGLIKLMQNDIYKHNEKDPSKHRLLGA